MTDEEIVALFDGSRHGDHIDTISKCAFNCRAGASADYFLTSVMICCLASRSRRSA